MDERAAGHEQGLVLRPTRLRYGDWVAANSGQCVFVDIFRQTVLLSRLSDVVRFYDRFTERETFMKKFLQIRTQPIQNFL